MGHRTHRTVRHGFIPLPVLQAEGRAAVNRLGVPAIIMAVSSGECTTGSESQVVTVAGLCAGCGNNHTVVYGKWKRDRGRFEYRAVICSCAGELEQAGLKTTRLVPSRG